MSASVTVALGRSIAMPCAEATFTSGITSKTAAYFRSEPGLMGARGSMRGFAAGVSFSWLSACANELRMRSLTTSVCTWSPNCFRTTAYGALPGRKPFSRAVREICFNRCSTSEATSVAGTATSSRRSSPPVADSDTCIS